MMEVKSSQSGFGEEIVLVEDEDPQLFDIPSPKKSPKNPKSPVSQVQDPNVERQLTSIREENNKLTSTNKLPGTPAHWSTE